ncbi:glucose dehydrogenase [Tsukamurella sputi]|uniref:Glucose dehydrogenase n=1 Tax=Tsukamurella sputi TaxID=2591848 RepID=A0A5C5RU59_9ACTN|nr:PQQ-dependent sugar dehydrogenase [Tsukamurella sputi]TWS26122.1 glucose dehydrogenase [Tsukamurella sputi]
MDVGTRRARSGARRTVVVAVVAALLAGCADFSGSEAAPFTGPPTGAVTTTKPTGPAMPSAAPKAPGPCIDQNPLVLATCLTEPTDLIPTGDFEHAYVAERGGAIMYTTTDLPNREVLRVGVDTSGDGGLTAIALSPSYDQDRLFYAYVSTPTDNRVVRVTPGDEPKVILSGIPKGATGNAGSLLFSGRDLIVATGNAGDANAARDPASLAGKVLLLPSPGTVSPVRPKVLATDGGVRQSLCGLPRGGPVFIADQGITQDRLRVLTPNSPASVVWSWPDRPGLAGCAVVTGAVFVSESRTGKVEMLKLPEGPTTADGEPIQVLDRAKYGVFGRLAIGPKDLPQGVTTNKPAPQAPTDDRVVLIPMPGGEATTSDD